MASRESCTASFEPLSVAPCLRESQKKSEHSGERETAIIRSVNSWLPGGGSVNAVVRSENNMHTDIEAFNEGQASAVERQICATLAASMTFTHPAQIRQSDLKRWISKSRTIQWDYRNLVGRKGKLVRLK